ncbi:MAG TPA: response regulator transcription factor [Campylobacterales bacterium]|nr:response regulator transcription factor [Campylobacterales bacterium]
MKKAKILLLEDDLNLNETIKEYLEDEGFEVDAAYDSDEAFEKIYENSYDILLLGVMVPGENGGKGATLVLERQRMTVMSK